ncbi:unnamed protein product [Vitrella brassicaformis CCMP3155]|uniref:Uncharacterized protein n=1 Tax=Vitrella brassicaformis (strain CCMP3155) TaxID=1169540 RepID=A0A0G4EKH6_VITBC|nr:unnamed protein product [Vitrella brassicaformis CCMP3155]|eukprot:CEL97033.1 unnamed protein product [Vitrella brassicaformis CCMP3155]
MKARKDEAERQRHHHMPAVGISTAVSPAQPVSVTIPSAAMAHTALPPLTTAVTAVVVSEPEREPSTRPSTFDGLEPQDTARA